jgi:hypothetical protein
MHARSFFAPALLRTAAPALFALGVVAPAACAAEMTRLSGGAVKSPLTEVIASFETATGHRVKADYAPMGSLTKRLEGGEIELGLHRISEILPAPDVKLVGELPAPIQKYTVSVASVGQGSAQADLARRFIAHADERGVAEGLRDEGFRTGALTAPEGLRTGRSVPAPPPLGRHGVRRPTYAAHSYSRSIAPSCSALRSRTLKPHRRPRWRSVCSVSSSSSGRPRRRWWRSVSERSPLRS